jgi:hypothetical protein
MANLRRLASAPYGSVIGDTTNHYRDSLVFAEFKVDQAFGKLETFARLFGERYEFRSAFAYDGVRDPAWTLPYEERDPSTGYGLEVQLRTPMGGYGSLTIGSEQKWARFKTDIRSEGEHIDAQVNSQSGNTYVQADFSFQGSTSLTLGLQHATQRITAAEQEFGGTRRDYPLATLQDLTPRVAFILNPTPVDIVKILSGTGYRYPTQNERYYEDGQGYVANPDLRPEKIRTHQLIWVHIWGGGVQSQLGWSESIWQNLIELQDNGDGMLQSQNLPGTIRGRSLETEIAGRHPGWVWMVHAGAYRWKRGDGTSFPDNARIQATARLTRTWGPWSLTGEARHVGAREDEHLGVSAPAATTLRTALRWDQGRAWVAASIEDLTHARRVDLVPLDYEPIMRMASDGRQFRLTAGWRF